jgi:hypothetical protein
VQQIENAVKLLNQKVIEYRELGFFFSNNEIQTVFQPTKQKVLIMISFE